MKIIWTLTLLMIPGVLGFSVTGYSGGGVSITCRYETQYRNNAKYFCKGQNLGCSDLIKTEMKDRWVYSGRFSLYDNTSAAVFTVNIKDLREEDSGTYQCVADISWAADSYTEVNLKVLTDKDVSKTTSSPSSSSSSSSSSSVFKASESPLVLQDSSLIISLVLVLLVLIIVGVFLLVFCKKIRSGASDLSSQSGAGKHELDSHTVCVYEDIKDSLPTNPSVSPDCVYATVQKESQTFITSAEDLNYAVVNFQKDCPDRVRSRNDQDYTEYAAISYLHA
ncbi:CMRF35-like molecule 2 isoform X1 [Puntigrus tetrazona]|uniref:CMRF35-like molecule 2 isoform X1 n=1 Tax=Puntigrus tetrazona TaxID=1606681 RepID=UPI001C8917D5|nr:CMRF35-like molecule 2 isoform X1 [Puntigrus tetrazona]